MSGVLIAFIVIGLPVLGGLALAAFSQWLKYRSRMDISPERYQELMKELQSLKTENAHLRKRIENLETIVSSADWDRLFAQEAEEIPLPSTEDPEEKAERHRRRERET